MTINLPNPPRVGDPLSATFPTELIRKLKNAMQVKTAGPVRSSWGDAGLLISLGRMAPDYLFPARITRVYPQEQGFFVANTVYYDAAALKRSYRQGGGFEGMVLEHVRPAFGRCVKGDEADVALIRPCRVGAFCWILRDVDLEDRSEGKLVILSGGEEGETQYQRVCTPPPGGGGGRRGGRAPQLPQSRVMGFLNRWLP